MGIPLRRWSGAGPRRSIFSEGAPRPSVAAVVDRAWLGRAGCTRALRVFPDGCADLVWDGRTLTVVTTAGGTLRHALPSTAWTVGLRLRCGTGGALLGLSMPELAPGGTSLRELWGVPAERAEEALAGCATPRQAHDVLEGLVLGRLRRGVELDRLSIVAARALRVPDASVAQVATGLGVSERGLRRHVRHEVGVGPKELQRVARFQRFLTRVGAVATGRTSLADAAAELGYADQSHLGRDCRRLSGSSPAGLVRSWSLAETFQTASGG